MREELANLIRNASLTKAKKEYLLQYIDGLDAEFKKTTRVFRRLQLDFETVIEIVSQINAKSLDLQLIENFTLNTIMGQFAANRVFLMRTSNDDPATIVEVAAKNMESPLKSFGVKSKFAARLTKIGRPFRLKGAKKEFKGIAEFTPFVGTETEVLVPLVKLGSEDGNDIKGLLGVGKKFNKQPFSEKEMDFLALIGSIVAISLHNAQLYRRSIYDSLTHVFSRGHFDVRLYQEIERVRRLCVQETENSKSCVSLVMFDIDDFKNFNDTYGHQIGDEILRLTAAVTKSHIRDADVVARYGGEEFCIILPDTNKKSALIAIERLRSAIAKSFIDTPEYGRLMVTVSLGIATFPDNADDAQMLLREADKALYAAKGKGKNCIEVAPDEVQKLASR